MKTSILTTLATLFAAQIVHAGEIYCGANIEQTPGSKVYDKLLFWEKAEPSESVVRFLLSDGSLIRTDSSQTAADLTKVTNGTLAIGTSTQDGKLTVFSGRVKRDQINNITLEDLAISVSIDGGTPMLIANDVSVVCKEM